MKWYLEPIDSHLLSIKELFAKNRGHKHQENYISDTLFEHTKFSRMAYDKKNDILQCRY